MGSNCCDTGISCGCGDINSRKNKLCKLTRPHNHFDMKKILPLVNDPKYVCSCCGRLANKEENLCKPIKLTN